MKNLLLILNSRRSAVWLLLIILAALVASTFLPNEITLTSDEWALLAKERPSYHRLAATLSTPYLVRNPVFTIPPFFLFLSTLVCTATRLHAWRRRESEFSKEKAFSFAVDGRHDHPITAVEPAAFAMLEGKGWECSVETRGTGVSIAAQKGIRLSFWGSIAFHIGLLLCFLAVPVSALTRFNGSLILTEGVKLPLREAVEAAAGSDMTRLPPVDVAAANLRGVYAKGRFKVDFGGELVISGSGVEKRLPFGVNNPTKVEGFQFSLQEFGFSPRIVVEKDGSSIFDYYANLRHGEQGDYFPLEAENSRLFVVLFPDFFQEGGKIGSRSREPRNPCLLVKIVRGEETIYKGLLKVGESAQFGDYLIKAGELKNWVGLAVTREHGLTVLILGLVVGIAGLFVRFLSNERRLELELFPSVEGTAFRLKGYSRYYPAFLEREVSEIAQRLKEGLEVRGR